MKKWLKKRKKGTIFLEFLLALPIFIALCWGIVQTVFYLQAQSRAKDAAVDIARVVSMEMRGNDKKLDSLSTEKTKLLKNKIYDSAVATSGSMGTLSILRDEHGKAEKFETFEKNILLDPADQCASIDSQDRVICVYTKDVTASTGITQQQIIVKIKGKFLVQGNVFGKAQLDVGGNGVSQKDLPGRFQYIE